jgi:hypothetical protein
MPAATATSGPLTVVVRAQLVDVLWSFGDGGSYDSGESIGRPYPAASDVQHVYQTDTYGSLAGYTVNVTLRFSVSYQVNGGPWTLLGFKARTYSSQYSVNQAQPEGGSNQ